MILLPIYVLNSIFVEDLKTQILKFEAKKKIIIIILIIDNCRFVEIESETYKVCRDAD